MSKFTLRAPLSLYLLFILPLGALAVFLFYVGALDGFFAVLAFILFLSFFTFNVQVIIQNQKLTIQNKYRKKTIIELKQIISIKPVYGGAIPGIPTMLKVKLENGNNLTVLLTLFDSKEIQSFLSILFKGLPIEAVPEKLRIKIQKNEILKSEKKAKVGASIIFIGIAGFFVSGFYFDTFGKEIVVHSLQDALGIITELFFVLFAFYGVGYMEGGNKKGVKRTLAFLVTMVVAALIGALFVWV